MVGVAQRSDADAMRQSVIRGPANEEGELIGRGAWFGGMAPPFLAPQWGSLK